MTLSSESGFSAGTVVGLVGEHALRQPTGVALADPERTLTWRELDERSAHLAEKLNQLGVQPESAVGLYAPSSAAMVVGALGIMKAGGAYLPLDPAQPSERLEAIVRDAGASVIVTAGRPAPWAFAVASHVVAVDEPAQRAPDHDVNAAPEATRDNLAYIIYTSGSTGRPKGVEVTHRCLRNLVAWHQRAFDITSADRASQIAGVGFDAAVWEVWPYLAAGASLHVPPARVRSDAEALRDWLVEQRITVGFVPTVMAERLIELAWPKDTALRIMLTGGDALHSYPPAGLPFKLVNNYGPTECTVVATSGVVRADGDACTAPSIGRPIDNVRAHVLDGQLREVPDGTPGELCIGGPSVARGYRNHPELTAERFIADPFSANPNGRLYRTGDIVRRLPGGELAFVGRLDDQVKIRGYRIEPGEVTYALKAHEGVRDAMVVACDDDAGGKRLVAYWVPSRGDTVPDPQDLLPFLRRSIPDYMVPSAFVQLEELPLTPNGKVDRAALLAPPDPADSDDDDFVEPRTPVERDVAQILAPLLGLDRVSAEANFFLLGGHSLLGTQLIARLRDSFDVDFSLRALFEAPTVAAIAAEVERLAAVEAS